MQLQKPKTINDPDLHSPTPGLPPPTHTHTAKYKSDYQTDNRTLAKIFFAAV